MTIPTSICFGDAVRWDTYGLPCPSTPYQYEVDSGLIRTKYDDGYARQRRKYSFRPHTFGLTFDVSAGTLQTLSEFVNTYGYTWFYMPLVSGMAGVPRLVDHLVRVISNLQVNYQGYDLYRVTFTAECYTIDPECATEQACGLIKACLLNAYIPPLVPPPYVDVDFGTICSDWGDEAYWGNPNG